MLTYELCLLSDILNAKALKSFQNIIWILLLISLAPLEIDISGTQFQLTKLVKIEDFEHIRLTILPPKINPL